MLAPVVVTALLPVEGDPEVAHTAAHLHRNNAAPATKASVIKIKFGIEHTFLTVDAIICTLIEIVAADEQSLSLYSYEAAAGFGAFLMAACIAVASEGIVGGEEGIAVFFCVGIQAANCQMPSPQSKNNAPISSSCAVPGIHEKIP